MTGLQSTGVGASVKHFAANNAETDRMRASSDVDARTLREIYLRAFHTVVQQAQPWTVMCSYNRINGVYASENRWLLTDVLRDEWGFDGVVVSDWGAVSNRVAAVAAGLDLQMPGSGDLTDAHVVAAVQAGVVSEADVDRAAQRIARLSARVSQHQPEAEFDSEAHHALARQVAGQAVVLLKNDDALLPLSDENIAVDLLRTVTEVQPRTVAVLSHGGVVRSGPVAELASAVLDGALLGQAGGGAIADVLFGRVNPSGRLAETVPLRLEDAPSYLNFPGEAGHVRYGERIFVGYRGYDAMGRDVAYPFGHGLSYTEFSYADLSVEVTAGGATVRVTVTNSGGRRGREVVQVYAGLPGSAVSRPPRWLVSFGDVTLDPGECARCELSFAASELAYWDIGSGRWVIESGEYAMSVGASSRDLRLTQTVTVVSALADMGDDLTSTLDLGADLLKIVDDIPIGRIIGFTAGKVSADDVRALLEGGQPRGTRAASKNANSSRIARR